MFIPTMAPQDQLINDLTPFLVSASKILQEEYQIYCEGREFSINQKQDDSPVTQADLKVNQYLIAALAQLTPELPVLSEESDYAERHAWSRCWMLDPLDGTKEFIHKRNEFTINLSLIDQDKTIFSALAVPCEQVFYLGYLHQLPLKYDIQSQCWYQYQSQIQEIETVQLGLSHRNKNPHYLTFLEQIQRDYPVIRRESGSAYKFCMMLEGRIDIYPRFHPTCEWDTSAGQGLLESIGGGLIDLQGRPFTYNQRETVLNGEFIAYVNEQSKQIALNTLAQINLFP